MSVAEFFHTTLKMVVPGLYLGGIIVFVVYIRHRVKGRPKLPWSTQLMRLILYTAGATLVLSIAVWLLLGVVELGWGTKT